MPTTVPARPVARNVRPLRAARAVILPAVLSATLAACGAIPAIGERSWAVATSNQLGAEQTVRVIDTSGLVTDVAFDPQDADLFGGVTAAPGDRPALDVTWTAAACDVTTELRVSRSDVGLAVLVRSSMDAAGCDAFGVPRAVRLVLAQPVAPAAVTVTQETV